MSTITNYIGVSGVSVCEGGGAYVQQINVPVSMFGRMVTF